ncbi:hypothetical protein ZTR_02447 [Talaromyces verruculosus]|nr:hypothetical protein ZTR_02447 [Talaromyces verruculosus]
MSFGYSIGDFVSLLELTNRIRKRFIRAPVEFRQISEDIKKLGVVLQDIDDFESEEGLNPQQKASIGQISQACHSVLTDLEQMLNKYQELDHEMDTLGNKTRRVWKGLQWDQSKISDYRERIDSYMILFSNVIARLNGNVILAVKDGVDRLCQHQEDEEAQAILEWLTPIDYTAQQNDILGQREEGTGQWLLERDEFKSWASTKQQTLFCLGIPGAGKTTLAPIIIDHLEQKFHADPDVGIAYIYCNFQSTPDLDIHEILASLVKQLIQRQSELPKTVIDMYRNYRKKNTRPRTDELASSLRSVASDLSTTFIIVDALDECATDYGLREKLLQGIFTLQAQCNINFLATSRHIPEIMVEFDRKTWLEIRADPSDVKAYLSSQLSTFPSFLLQNQDLVDEIITTITESVDGMFLLARLHLSSLRGKSSPKAIRTALQKLHTGSEAYDHAYKDAMERIEQQGTEKRDLAKNILSWITCAKRRLTVDALVRAVAVEIGLSYLDEENLSDMQYMMSVCAGLIAVDEESGIIRLIHYTTQEYFERTWQTWFPDAHRYIAMISLTYLSFDQFATGPCANWEGYIDRLQENSLYHYAARYWGYHAKEAYSEVKGLVDKFFQCTSALISAALVLFLERNFRSYVKVKELLENPGYHAGADNRGRVALHLAIRNAQASTVELLVREGVDVNSADQNDRTALHYAASQGDNRLIQLLVKNGAHLEAVDKNGQTPFLTAADHVKIASVQELLSYDIAINAVNPKNQNALHLAILAKKDETPRLVGILLSHGICPTLCDVKNMTPVHYAVAIGNLKIVQMFLEAGVDINFGIERKCWTKSIKAGRPFYVLEQSLEKTNADLRDAVGLTPLHFAAYAGRCAMTGYLLTKGANPNVRCSSDGDTPLHIALRRGLSNKNYEDAWTNISWMIETEFIAHDETVCEERSFWHEQELYHYINKERLEVVNMLLASIDIDVNIQNIYLDTPLHTMASIFYGGANLDTIVTQLLQKGADPLKRNKKGQTALHLACEANDLIAVDRFLNAGCSITTEDAEGLTALHYTARANRYQLTKLILDRHKDIAPNLCVSPGRQGRTLLHDYLQFQSRPQVHMITLLLDQGANVNHLDLDGNSPLSTYLRTPRTFGDRTAISHFLLKRGANPLWTDGNGQTLAHVAMNNYEAEVGVLELLNAYGLDLSMKDKQGRSFLHYGAIYGSLTDRMIIPFLLRNKLDGIYEGDLEDKSPLMHAAAGAEAAKEGRRRAGRYCPPGWRRSWKVLKQMENHTI